MRAIEAGISTEEARTDPGSYMGTRPDLNQIMRLLGRKYPRWYVRRLAAHMGLAIPKPADWTAAEESYVAEHYPKMGVKALQKGLRHNFGVSRSTTAIHVKVKRLGLLSADGEGFTLRGLCKLLWNDQENLPPFTAGWRKDG